MRAGDEDAMRVVYRDVQPRLLRYLTVMVGVADAEDVASETWAQAFRDLDRFAGDADGFRGWITTIGRHRALDHLRRRQRQPVGDLDLMELLDRPTGEDVEGLVLDAVGTQDALRMLAGLPRDQAEAILLRTVLGFDAPTAARILGKRPGAVRSAAHRGLRALARQLEDPEKNVRPTRDTSPEPDAEGLR
ncbi:RNA polymerase sigma factor [Nocardioides piscis]|uniref:RNA polymerase sigma factor n=2 Tax=Nocardioides piscis TaxID=2714938 RepID=A0A6G7YKM0_9ACTN|nr:RNA polymerase sigma factor [Nocardioides piscis]